jgi:hypothetical protein
MVKEVGDTLAAFHRDSTALIGWNTVQSPEGYRADLTYEIHGTGWGLVTVVLTRREGGLALYGFHFTRMVASLGELNAFHIAGRSWRHYLVLVLAIVCLLFCLVTAIIVLRTPMPRRWLWALVSLVGIGVCSINWTTGGVFVNPAGFLLLCAAYLRPGLVGQWTVSFALPVGAAVALWRRH